MAIDFSKVKTITIPEGSVKKITDSTGAVLWKEQPNNWHTIWEGNKTIKYTPGYGTQGETYNFASTANGTGFAPRLRITFSFSNGSKYSSSDYFKYYKGSYNDLSDNPTIPTTTSQLDNDSGYQTASDVSTAVSTAISSQTKETWTFTLSDGSTVTKTVVLG